MNQLRARGNPAPIPVRHRTDFHPNRVHSLSECPATQAHGVFGQSRNTGVSPDYSGVTQSSVVRLAVSAWVQAELELVEKQSCCGKRRLIISDLHTEMQPGGPTATRMENVVTHIDPYDLGLDKNGADYVPLSPLSFIERAAFVYPNHIAVIHGDWQITWKQCYDRCLRLASALKKRGIGIGDTVALTVPNVPAMYEAHFAVPMIGAVLNTLNLRLDAEAIGFMLQHGEAKVVITDREYSAIMERALPMLEERPLVIDIDDPEYQGGKLLGEKDYEAFLLEGDANFEWSLPEDEWNAIALNYTSGTTGNPKGVVYHHRGAYLNAVSNILSLGMPHHSVYLWTLPMFHCNGWCFPWTMAANAGTNVCLRRIDAKAIFNTIRLHKVTHFCAAPIVHSMLINAPEEMRSGIEHKVSGCIAGAAPPASVIEGMERIGFDITHVYGLTETYGPAAVCAKQESWNELPLDHL